MNEIIIPKSDKYCIADDANDCWIIGETNPPRKSPYEGSPHVAAVYEPRNFEWFMDNIDSFRKFHGGTVILFSGLWKGGSVPTGPSLIEPERYSFYEYAEPTAVVEFIKAVQFAGMNVLGYTYQNQFNNQWADKPWAHQLLDLYLFARTWNLDGWYLDGGWFGSHLRTLRAFKFLSEMELKLFHHETVSMIGTNSQSWLKNPFGTMPNVHLWPYTEWTVRNESPYNKEHNGLIYNHWPMDEAGWQRAVEYGGPTLNHMIWYTRSGEGNPPITADDFNRECANRGLLRIAKASNWPEWQAYAEMYEAKRQEAQDGEK